MTLTIPARPPITRVAKFLMITENLEKARRFYSGVLGYGGCSALQNPANDKLIHIGFATAAARRLRDDRALQLPLVE